ncbi:dead deah box helicase domain-containing protein [Cystoisospora suis]|uniref:Dead deah box helicase domain-containing protein n=1 Tax=Cystoisospora suis TaxID=483139 RepID=A0A2C6L2X1_9APIC|nr:dead deah box helicase domain-containing protein [Cystoisospora suis]
MVHQGGGVKQEEGGDDEGREEPEASPEEEDGLKQVQQDLVSTRSTPSQKASIDSSTQQSSFAFHDAVEPHSFEDSRREYFHKTNNRLDPFLLLPPSSSPTPGNVDSEKPHLSLLVPDETAQTPFAPHLPHQRSRDVQQEQQKDGEESGGEGQERGVNAKAKQVFLFPDFGLDSSLLMSLDKTGLKVPSPVQVSAIPRALQGKNLLVQAKSGTGKTVAFSLSLLQRLIWRYQSDCLRQTNLSSSSSSSGLLSASLKRPDDEKEKKRTTFGVAMALVLAPTRELAVQIANEVHRLAWFMREPPLRYACLFGGSPLSICQEKLKHQPHILIATPGRLLSLLRNKQTQRVLGTWTCDCLSFHQELLKREKGKKEDASSKKQTFYGEKPSTDLLLEARGHLVEEHNEEKEAGEEEQEKGEKKGEKEEEDEEAMNTNASENREEEGRQSEDDGEEEEEEEKQQGAQKRVKDREEKEGEQREEKRDETRSEKKEDETEEKQERENLVGKGKEEGINKIEQEEDKEKNKKNSKKNEKNKKGEDILFCRPCRRLPSSRRLQRHLEIIVLDEADLLLDHFFRHQVQALLKSLLHPHMQLLAFSATFPPPLISFLENFVEDLDEARYTSALQSQKKKEEEEQRQRALSFVVAHALAEKEGGGLSLKGEKEGSFSLTKELAEAYMNRARNFEKEGRDSNEKRKKENCKEDTHGEERKRREEEVREEEEEIEGESSISKKRVEGKDTGEEGSIREGVQKRHSQEGKKREGEEGEEEEEENITEVQEKVVSSGVVGVVGEEQMIRERHEETHSSRDLREKNGSLNSPFVSSSCFRSEESHRGEKRENNGAEKVDASHALETGKQTKASAPRGREVGSMIPMRSEPRCFEKILLCSSWILHSREGKTSLHKREEENKKTEINGSEVVRKGEEEEETKVDGREGSSLKKASMGKKRSAAEVARALAMKYGTPSSPSPPPPLSSLSSSSSSLSFSSSSSSSSSTSTHRISFSSEAHPLSSVSPSLSSQLQPLSFSSSCASLSPSSSGPREMKSETNDRKREEDSMKDQSPGSSGDMSSPPKKALEMLEERKDMRGRDTSSSFIGSSKEEEEKKKSLEGGESLRERKECLVSSSSSPPSSSLCSISFPSQQNREGSIAEAEELDREPLSHVDRPSDKKSSPSGDLAFSAKTTNPDDRLDTSDFYSTQKQEDRQTLALSSPSLSSSTPSSSSSSLRPSLPSPLLEGIYYALLIVPDEPTVMRQLGAKVRVLLQVFSSLAFRQAIVFCNDQESGAQVAMCLNQLGVSALYTR